MMGRIKSIKLYLLLLIAAILAVLIFIAAIKIVFPVNQSFDYISVSKEKLEDSNISKSIALGLKQRKIYIDAYHALIPANPYIFDSLKISYEIGQGRFTNEQNKLFSCGILLMDYSIGKPDLSDDEYLVVKKFMVNGGRVMLLCPIWVWEAYDKKSLKASPYYKIAQYYGLEMSSAYAAPPLRIDSSYVNDENPDFIESIKGTFSSINCLEKFTPIIVGQNGKVAVALACRDKSKIFIWSHSDLFCNELVVSDAGKEFLLKIFGKMFSRDEFLPGKKVKE